MKIFRLAVAPAAIVVGLCVLAAGTSAATTRPCRASRLSATMTHIFGSEGAGSTGYLLKLVNHGARACAFGDHVGLQLIDARGSKLPTHPDFFGPRGPVTIAASHSVSARLRFSPDIPGVGEPGRGPCEPQAHTVLVALRAPASGGLAAAVKPPTSVCEHGQIEEQALR
jgi:hypothetical protein